MEHKHTYQQDLAQRVAALSAPQEPQAASSNEAPYKQNRQGFVAATALALVLLASTGMWYGFRASAASPTAEMTAATASDVLPVDAVAAPLINANTPVLGAGTLMAAQMIVLHSDAATALLSLSADEVIAAGTPAFLDAPALPFDARVLLVDTMTGDVTLMRADDYQVVLPVAEVQLSRVAIGDTAEVQFDAISGETFTATVTTIAPMVTAGRGTVNVALTLQNPPTNLRPNMAARITLCGCAPTQPVSVNG